MKKLLLPLVLLVLSSVASFGQAKVVGIPAGGVAGNSVVSLLTNNGSVDYNSSGLFVTIDLGTHYFGFGAKMATFRSANAEENRHLDQIFNINACLFEFTPDNPSAIIKELEKGASLSAQIPGILKLSGIKSPMTIPVTLSRDSKGIYHASTDFTVNSSNFKIQIPEALASTYTGSFRIQINY